MIVSVNIMGGLGNQLFQIASAYAYAKKENGILQIVKKKENGNRPLYWDVFKKLSPYLVESIPKLEQWYEQEPTVYTDIGPLIYPGKCLNEYLQSSKYFNKVKNEIKELFKDEEIICHIKNKYKFLCDNSERVIVIHARRTDYINYKDYHGPLESIYYKKALEQMIPKVQNPIFLLSSDDNNFWNEIKNDIMPVFNNYTIINDIDINIFFLLQQFNNFIMSNSTYIWWIVWLSDAKNVITPSKWFGPKGPSKYEDIYEDSWIRI